MTQRPHPDQPLHRDNHGVIRFKPNAIVRYILDQPGGLDLNDLSRMGFSQADWDQFAQLIGYSKTGYDELSYVSNAAKDRTEAAARLLRPKQAARKGRRR